MKKFAVFFIILFGFTLPAYAEPLQVTDAALNRVAKKRELNCGVYTLGTIFSFDATGKPQGFTVDLFNEVALRAGLSVRYTEITDFGLIIADMDAGKYDMICAPALLIPATVLHYLPGNSIVMDEINVYASSKKDVSGIQTLDDLNSEKYSFVGMDGELGGIYVPQLFPKATLKRLASGLPASHMFLELSSKKVDFMVLSRIAAKSHQKEHPDTLQKVTSSSLVKPSIRLFYPLQSHALRANIEAVIDDLRQDGTLESLLKKHGLID